MAKAIVTSIFINGFEIERHDDMTWGPADDLLHALSPEPTPQEVEELVDRLRNQTENARISDLAQINETPPEKDIIAKPELKPSHFIDWEWCIKHFKDVHINVPTKFEEFLEEPEEKDENAINVLREFWQLCEEQYPGQFLDEPVEEIEDVINVLKEFWQLCEEIYPGQFLDGENAIDVLREFWQLCEENYPGQFLDEPVEEIEDVINVLREFWQLCEEIYPGQFLDESLKEIGDAINVLTEFWKLCEDQYPGQFLIGTIQGTKYTINVLKESWQRKEYTSDNESDLEEKEEKKEGAEEEKHDVTTLNTQGCEVDRQQQNCLLCNGVNFDHHTTECPEGKTLYHGTQIGAIKPIAFEGLAESTKGTLGPGIYFVEKHKEAECISRYRRKPEDGSCSVVLKCKVFLGQHIDLGRYPSKAWQQSNDSASCIHGPWANIRYPFIEFCLRGSIKSFKKKDTSITMQRMIPIFIINGRDMPLPSEQNSKHLIGTNTEVAQNETDQQQNGQNQISMVRENERTEDTSFIASASKNHTELAIGTNTRTAQRETVQQQNGQNQIYMVRENERTEDTSFIASASKNHTELAIGTNTRTAQRETVQQQNGQNQISMVRENERTEDTSFLASASKNKTELAFGTNTRTAQRQTVQQQNGQNQISMIRENERVEDTSFIASPSKNHTELAIDTNTRTAKRETVQQQNGQIQISMIRENERTEDTSFIASPSKNHTELAIGTNIRTAQRETVQQQNGQIQISMIRENERTEDTSFIASPSKNHTELAIDTNTRTAQRETVQQRNGQNEISMIRENERTEEIAVMASESENQSILAIVTKTTENVTVQQRTDKNPITMVKENERTEKIAIIATESENHYELAIVAEITATESESVQQRNGQNQISMVCENERKSFIPDTQDLVISNSNTDNNNDLESGDREQEEGERREEERREKERREEEQREKERREKESFITIEYCTPNMVISNSNAGNNHDIERGDRQQEEREQREREQRKEEQKNGHQRIEQQRKMKRRENKKKRAWLLVYQILKTIFKLCYICNCIWSAVHLRSKVNSPAGCVYFVFIGLQSIANSILLYVNFKFILHIPFGFGYHKKLEYILLSNLLIAFGLEVPMLVAQVFVIKLFQNDGNAVWSEFSLDIALQFQFIFNLILFGSFDTAFHIFHKNKDWILVSFFAAILAPGCLFTPVHLAQLGWVWQPELSDFGGGEISSGTIHHLLSFSMAIGALGLWIWPIVFPILYLGSLCVFFRLNRPWYTCLKAFLKLASAFNGFWSVCHLYSLMDSAPIVYQSTVIRNFRFLIIIYASLFGLQVFVNLVLDTYFAKYESEKKDEAYNIYFLIARYIIIVIFFELPTLCLQASAMKQVANLKLSDTIKNHEGPDSYFMRWSELGWDFSMQLQFMIQIVLFSMIDLNFCFQKSRSKLGFLNVPMLILVLLALCACFTPVYLIQVGAEFKPTINDYGGVVDPDDYGIIGLMYISIGVGVAGFGLWTGVASVVGVTCFLSLCVCCCKKDTPS